MAGKSSVFIPLVAFLLVSFLALQCKTTEQESMAESTLIQLEYAEKFSVYTLGNDTVISVRDGKQEWLTEVSRSSLTNKIQLPVKSINCLSTSHLYYFSELNSLGLISAVSFAENLKDPSVIQSLENGSLQTLSPNGQEYDSELVLSLSPNLFTTYPYGDDEFSRLNQAGIQTLHFTEYLEPHPLGRLEWVKLAGFLIGKEKEAEAYFNAAKDAYQLTKLKALTKKIKRPTVLNVNGYASKWTAPSGNSLVSNFITDAGGDYVFRNDTASGNLELDFEKVYQLADEVDYWASVVFADSVSAQTLVGTDGRLLEAKSIAENRIFYCNASEKDYFGKAMLEPQKILEDLYQIFYSDSVGYNPIYFERMK